MSTLKQKYREEVTPGLSKELGVGNPMQIPRCLKVVVNMGIGIARRDQIKPLTENLAAITGQRPLTTKARKSISNFKLREGMAIGCKVTLRGDRMYEFLDRLINVALPRIRDFRGVSPSGFDGRGNYTMGVKDQTIFAEIDPNNVTATQGMDITIVTSAGSDQDARQLLKLLGMPFSEK